MLAAPRSAFYEHLEAGTFKGRPIEGLHLDRYVIQNNRADQHPLVKDFIIRIIDRAKALEASNSGISVTPAK